MKIGLDYGGVISFSLDGWAKSIALAKSRGHEIYIVSHAQKGDDLRQRADYAIRVGAVDLSFADLKSVSQEREIAERKAEICEKYGIEIFIDDDLHRTDAVGRRCKRCAAFYIPQSLWQIGQMIVHSLPGDW